MTSRRGSIACECMLQTWAGRGRLAWKATSNQGDRRGRRAGRPDRGAGARSARRRRHGRRSARSRGRPGVDAAAGFAAGQHAEAGADLIEEEQEHVLTLARRAAARSRVRILRDGCGFYGPDARGSACVHAGPATFERAQELLAPEIAASSCRRALGQSGVAQRLGRQSVAGWLERAKADAPAARRRARVARLLPRRSRGSVAAAAGRAVRVGASRAKRQMYRLVGGNDGLATRWRSDLRGRLLLEDGRARDRPDTIAVRVADRRRPAASSSRRTSSCWRCRPRRARRRLRSAAAPRAAAGDRAPALRRRDAAAPAVRDAVLEAIGRPMAFGTDLPTGAVWDGNEQQRGGRGSSASSRAATRRRSCARSSRAGDGRRHATARLAGRPSPLRRCASSTTWEHDPWARGGYAVFVPASTPLRAWLARPAGRDCLRRRAHQPALAGLHERRGRERAPARRSRSR